MESEEITRNDVHPVVPPRKVQSAVGSFLRRLTWRKEIGPLSGEARVEVRELVSEESPVAEPPSETPRA